MRIKTTALLLSALLPLSVWAMPEQGQQKQQNMHKHSSAQYGAHSEWRTEKMQKRQAEWFDRLELTAEQREAFQAEMQQHHQQQQKSRNAHQDKLRGLLTDEQRIKFDEDREKMQKRMKSHMHKYDKSKHTGQQKRSERANPKQE